MAKKSVHSPLLNRFASIDIQKPSKTLNDFMEEWITKEAMVPSKLINFLELGHKARLETEDKNLQNLSIKLSEEQKQLVDFVGKNLEKKSRSKVLQELVNIYSEAAYGAYLMGKFSDQDMFRHTELPAEYINLEGLIQQLEEDAQLLGEDSFPIWMLLQMGLVDEGSDYLNRLKGKQS